MKLTHRDFDGLRVYKLILRGHPEGYWYYLEILDKETVLQNSIDIKYDFREGVGHLHLYLMPEPTKAGLKLTNYLGVVLNPMDYHFVGNVSCDYQDWIDSPQREVAYKAATAELKAKVTPEMIVEFKTTYINKVIMTLSRTRNTQFLANLAEYLVNNVHLSLESAAEYGQLANEFNNYVEAQKRLSEEHNRLVYAQQALQKRMKAIYIEEVTALTKKLTLPTDALQQQLSIISDHKFLPPSTL